jgi:hypothetical protein
MPKYKFCQKKIDRCQNVQNFELSNFDFINFFDNLHGLATKCKKLDDELKKKLLNFVFIIKLNLINNLNNLITLI